MPNNKLLITRYPNRRFYARNESRYVSLQEIEELIRAGHQVEIRDSQSDEDLTGSTLARIIMERQPEKMRLFPIDLLHSILRSNDVMSDFLRDYFRQVLPYLEYLQQHSAATVAQPMHWMKAWMDNLIPGHKGDSKPGPAPGVHDGPLADRVAELEARLRQLESGDKKENSRARNRPAT